jgi:two-component system cell cycle sensor histidine kinase/response regulator CckA
VSFDRPRHFYIEELTALQHLANQIAMLLKLIEQQARKEQVLRSERLAATGEIISGVAGELKGPLDSILSLAHRLLDHGDSEVRAIVRESLRATAILSRYSQAAVSGESETSPIEVNAILARAVESSRKEIPSELTLDLSLSSDPLWIEGSPSQLENVFSNLLLLAARSAKPSLERTLRVESSLLIRRVIITIRYGTLFFDETLSAGALPPDQSGLGFGVCRGIVHSMGGDVRIVRAAENSCRIEIDLPAAFPTQEPAASPEQNERQPSRALTALILEPEASSQRRLISYWTSRHHRAVPIHDEGEALELLRRLRIDVIFCALRTGGGNWVEFFDRIRGHVPAFVLLAEGLGSDASTLFPEGEGFVLRKPLEAGEMDRMLERVETHLDSVASRT